MENFDIAKLKTGKYKAVTRNGNRVGSIVHINGEIIAYIDSPLVYNENGHVYDDKDDQYDLFLIEKNYTPQNDKKYYFINFISNGDYAIDSRNYDDSYEWQRTLIRNGNYFESLEEAKDALHKIKEIFKKD